VRKRLETGTFRCRMVWIADFVLVSLLNDRTFNDWLCFGGQFLP
jgi:hypothetical protein